MPNGTELAKAYVQIIPSAEGIKGKLTSILGGEAESAGETAGASIAGAIKKAIAAAGIGKIIKDALSEGADLQQSIGGIETLFKNDAETVMQYANEAYKTAGLSANSYMEQVTSFSASLLQSLKGNTKKAAESANAAIIAMADNANKMGTDMSAIQNAYQGFAKQNYTMLDNLKLGYGGTKKEMERLLADAEALSGVHYNIENLNDVYSAIQVIQDKLDITGTTAQEAADTFSGSLASMKAAAQNLLGNLTLGEDIGEELNALYQTVNTFFWGNLMPMVGNFIRAIPQLITTAVSDIANVIAERVLKRVDDFVESGIQIGTAIIEGLGETLPYLAEAVVHLMSTLGQAIIDINWIEVAKMALNHLRGALTDAAKSILSRAGGEMVRIMLADIERELGGAFTRIQQAMSAAFDRIKAVFEPLIKSVENYVNSGKAANDITDLLTTVIRLLADAVVIAAEVIATIVEKTAGFVKWLQSGSASAEVFKAVVVAVTAAIIAYKAVLLAMTVAENAATIAQLALNAAMSLNPVGLVIAGIAALVAAIVILVKNFDRIKEGIEALWGSVKEGAQRIYETLAGAFQRIVDFFKNIVRSARTWGHDLIQNFIDGIQDRIQHFIDTIKGLAENVRNFLGFSEPKVGPLSDFHTYAPDMMKLFAQGIRNNVGLVTDQIDRAFDIGSRISDYAIGRANAAPEPRRELTTNIQGTQSGNITIAASFNAGDDQLVRVLAPKLEAYWARRGAVL